MKINYDEPEDITCISCGVELTQVEADKYDEVVCEECYDEVEEEFEFECYGCKGGSNCCMSPHCP